MCSSWRHCPNVVLCRTASPHYTWQLTMTTKMWPSCCWKREPRLTPLQRLRKEFDKRQNMCRRRCKWSDRVTGLFPSAGEGLHPEERLELESCWIDVIAGNPVPSHPSLEWLHPSPHSSQEEPDEDRASAPAVRRRDKHSDQAGGQPSAPGSAGGPR